MTEDATVLYSTRGPVAHIELNRPRYRNAQSYHLLDELDAALDRAMADDEVAVVVLSGRGEHFSSGHDLGTPEHRSDLEQRGVGDEGLAFYDQFRKYNFDLTIKWRNLPKPTIAAVHGYCIYGGWMIATAMDVVFASPDARFLAGLFEYFSVPWDIHPRRAKELLFESRFISGEEASELGFVNRVIARERLLEETLAYAERVAENDPVALRMSKLAVNKAQDLQGYTVGVEGAFADYMVLMHTRGKRDPESRRMGGVELALRREREESDG